MTNGMQTFWRPRTVRKGVRVAIEIVLVLLITGLLVIRLSNPFAIGVVFIASVVAVVLLLLWTINDLVGDWLGAGRAKRNPGR